MLALALLSQRQSLNCEIIALGTASGEDYLLGVSPDEPCHLRASSIHRLSGNIARVMERRGIAKNLTQIGYHRIFNFRKKRSSSSVIQIHFSHCFYLASCDSI